MIRSMEEFRSAFHAARCVSTPLMAVRTADPASTTHFIIETLKQGRKVSPLLGWDVVRGLYAIGRDSGEELAHVLGERQAATIGPVDALFLAQQTWAIDFAQRRLDSKFYTEVDMFGKEHCEEKTPGFNVPGRSFRAESIAAEKID